MYTAAVLTPFAQFHLKKSVEELVPNTFEWTGHHMTLHMGYATQKDNLGGVVKMFATHFAKNDKVAAVRIGAGGEISLNKVPHVTVAVNREEGGKPYMSNEFAESDWIPLENLIDESMIMLIGKVEECK